VRTVVWRLAGWAVGPPFRLAWTAACRVTGASSNLEAVRADADELIHLLANDEIDLLYD
jgi:hypothetical protein